MYQIFKILVLILGFEAIAATTVQQEQQQINTSVNEVQQQVELTKKSTQIEPEPREQQVELAQRDSSEVTLKDPQVKRYEQQQVEDLYHSHSDWFSRFMDHQKAVEKDHQIREKWLIDNIRDLHREIKQTESDIDHFAKINKQIIDRNIDFTRRQLSQAMRGSSFNPGWSYISTYHQPTTRIIAIDPYHRHYFSSIYDPFRRWFEVKILIIWKNTSINSNTNKTTHLWVESPI